jgi:hypothetical protein
LISSKHTDLSTWSQGTTKVRNYGINDCNVAAAWLK